MKPVFGGFMKRLKFTKFGHRVNEWQDVVKPRTTNKITFLQLEQRTREEVVQTSLYEAQSPLALLKFGLRTKNYIFLNSNLLV